MEKELIRLMTPQDVAGLVGLTASVNWNMTAAGWLAIIAAAPRSSWAMEIDGRIAGSTVAIRFGDRLGWVSMVIVLPDFQRRGVATRLMQRALVELADCPCVGLVATEAGRLVYEQLDFRPYDEIAKFRGMTVLDCGPAPERILPLTAADLPEAAAWDRRFYDVDRSAALRQRWEKAPHGAWKAVDGEGRLAGFAMRKEGDNSFGLGPIAAMDVETARLLLRQALRAGQEKTVIMDVPVKQAGFLEMVTEMNFSPLVNMTRMFRGEPGRLRQEQYYALMGSDLG